MCQACYLGSTLDGRDMIGLLKVGADEEKNETFGLPQDSIIQGEELASVAGRGIRKSTTNDINPVFQAQINVFSSSYKYNPDGSSSGHWRTNATGAT